MFCKLSFIANQIGINFQGKDIEIDGIQTLKDATSSHISFFNDSKYTSQLSETRAAAVLIDEKHAHLLPASTQALITDEAYLKLAHASRFFAYEISVEAEAPSAGEGCRVDESVRFGKGVKLGENVTIMAGCYVGDNVSIDSDTLIHPNVTLYHHTCIGSECIVHSGTVIGCDGYGFAHTKRGEHVKIYQNGNVVVEDEVEIGSNCAIDRAVFGTTRIQKGTKLDNLVHIAHNCSIGQYNLVVGQVGMAGSTTTGRNVVFGGQSGTAGHLHIGDFTTIAAKSGVTKSLDGGKTYAGFPAIEHKLWLKLQAKISGLIKRK